MKEKIKYRHLPFGNGVVTIAFTMEEDWTHFKKKTYLSMGMSFCSPKEKSFIKKNGRERALERLNNPDTKMEVLISGNFPLSANSIPLSSFILIYADKINVHWVRKDRKFFPKKKVKKVAIGG